MDKPLLLTRTDLSKISHELSLLLEEAQKNNKYILIPNFKNDLNCYDLELLSHVSINNKLNLNHASINNNLNLNHASINNNLNLNQDPKNKGFVINNEKPIFINEQIKKNLINENLIKTKNNNTEKNSNISILNNKVPNQNPNFICNLCKNKVYPVKKYFHSPNKEKNTQAILFLYYNGAFSIDGKVNNINIRDNSAKNIFQDENEDKIFTEVLNKFGYDLDQFYFQEFPACHFNGLRSTNEDWLERAKFCTKHVSNQIRKNNIKKIVLIGNSAIALLGKEIAQEKVKQNAKEIKSFIYNFEDIKVECVVIRSMSSLSKLALQISATTEDNKKIKLEEEEKLIRNVMHNTLEFILK